ncbi:hypothetical protein F2Q70_00033929 [Brassica cretica]|uniref:Uncharacterized protein n=1 Tax=Brassica cretica TaxID=69181 RepID=A0A8S9JWU4_BRACR|nr:hypothetical protein F2Q70_00033929 [Brassica cretica]KAF3529412.1 hypothetical protein DY000_02036550 [Brassica cretica]
MTAINQSKSSLHNLQRQTGDTTAKKVPRQDKFTALGCASQTTDPPRRKENSSDHKKQPVPVSRLLREPNKGQSLTSSR